MLRKTIPLGKLGFKIILMDLCYSHRCAMFPLLQALLPVLPVLPNSFSQSLRRRCWLCAWGVELGRQHCPAWCIPQHLELLRVLTTLPGEWMLHLMVPTTQQEKTKYSFKSNDFKFILKYCHK